MNPKEKALELIEQFKDKVNPYIGSGMLSNTHDDDTILWQSKRCALVAVDEILNEENHFIQTDAHFLYWKQVKQEIETFNTNEK
jgi:hypothetical protein